MATLEAKHRAKPALCDRRANGIGRRRPLELGIACNNATRDVDLLELRPCVAGLAGHFAIGLVDRVASLAWDVDRPKLSADVTGFEPREVGHSRGVPAKVVRVDI